MTTYKKLTNDAGIEYIERTTQEGVISWIPIDEANADYQAYLDRDKPKAALSTPIVSGDE